jgi:integrase
VERKAYRRPKPTTFGAYREAWFEEGRTRRRWAPRTVIQYRSILKRLGEQFDPLRLGAIRPRQVAEYVSEKASDLEASTVSRDLSVLHDLFASAMREELVESNPAAAAEHPKKARRRWRILEPAEVGRVLRAFEDEQARVVFLTLVLTGIRRHELQGLRWRDVDLLDGVLRVRKSKTEEGERAIALPARLVEALSAHYQLTAYKGDDELVFCHPDKGCRYSEKTWAQTFRQALTAAGITDYVRPFHDLRHTALTNEAAAGSSPIALMTKAGHSDMKTTRIYLHLAGTVFRDEAEALERRLLGSQGGPGRGSTVPVSGLGIDVRQNLSMNDDIVPAPIAIANDVVGDEFSGLEGAES